MAHKFDPKNKHRLDSPERRKKFPPKKILRRIGIREKDSLADIGCGSGYFSLPASRLVGKHGTVFALDTSKEMLVETKKKIPAHNNIIYIQSKEYSFKLPPYSINVALVVFVLHEIIKKKFFLRKIKEILKRNGKVAIIEWKKEKTESGPPLGDRIAQEQTQQLLKESGFKNLREVIINKECYCITAKK